MKCVKRSENLPAAPARTDSGHRHTKAEDIKNNELDFVKGGIFLQKNFSPASVKVDGEFTVVS